MPSLTDDWKKGIALFGSWIWGLYSSDYIDAFFDILIRVDVEPLLIFLVGLFCVYSGANRYSGGFSVYWFCGALIVFSFFADYLDTITGGMLGLISI